MTSKSPDSFQVAIYRLPPVIIPEALPAQVTMTALDHFMIPVDPAGIEGIMKARGAISDRLLKGGHFDPGARFLVVSECHSLMFVSNGRHLHLNERSGC